MERKPVIARAANVLIGVALGLLLMVVVLINRNYSTATLNASDGIPATGAESGVVLPKSAEKSIASEGLESRAIDQLRDPSAWRPEPAEKFLASEGLEAGAVDRLVDKNTGRRVTVPESARKPDASRLNNVGDSYRDAYDSSLKSAPEPQSSKIDIGSGYSLVTESGETFLSKPELGVSQPELGVRQPAVSNYRIDIGSGYWLVVDTGETGRIKPELEVSNATPSTSRIDIGSGYWLVTGPDGGAITNGGPE